MNLKLKGCLINGIIAHMRLVNDERNKWLRSVKRHAECKEFDTASLWISLVFMEDEDFERIATLCGLGAAKSPPKSLELPAPEKEPFDDPNDTNPVNTNNDNLPSTRVD